MRQDVVFIEGFPDIPTLAEITFPAKSGVAHGLMTGRVPTAITATINSPIVVETVHITDQKTVLRRDFTA
jgi:hypothetical protein